MMAPGIEDADGNMLPGEEGDGVWNWPDWVKAGDVVVIDEVQRWWRPRGMGTKPPKMIKALETHRHMGIDFVIMTQNPMLIDQNVRRLVGRHQNIRRLLGMARAIVYDWDSCAADVTRTKTSTSTLWNYPKSAYKLYQSSVLHLKQKQKIPLWLAVPVLAVAAGLFVAPMAFGTLSGAMTGKGVGTAKAAEKKEVSILPDVTAGMTLPAASVPVAASSAPLPASPIEPAKPVFAGCVAVAKKCTCYDSAAVPVEVDNGICSGLIASSSTVPKEQIDSFLSRVPDMNEAVSQIEQQAADASVLAFMAGR
jgi:zona occludens toxin